MIRENPYRVLGVIGNSRLKLIQRNISKLQTYISIGKKLDLEFDNNFFGVIARSDETIIKAKSILQLDENRIKNALLWFISENAIDDIALEHIKKGGIEKAQEIWQKKVSKSQIDTENYSAYNNLSTLLLTIGLNDREHFSILKTGVKLKIDLLNSDYIYDFGKLICDENYELNKTLITEWFIDAVIKSLLKLKINDTQIIQVFDSSPNEIRDLVSGQFVKGPITKIDSAVEEAKVFTEKSKSYGDEFGRKLMNDTKKTLNNLNNILGKSHFKYKIYADKIAKQIEQCGVEYFNSVGDDYDYLDVYEYALQIAESQKVKNKLEEAIAHSKENEELTKCWFCSTKKIQNGYEFRVQMHKFEPYNYLDYGGRKYTYFKNGGYALGRCVNCHDTHTSGFGDNLLSKSIFGFKKLAGKSNIKSTSQDSIRNHPIINQFLKEGHIFGLPS